MSEQTQILSALLSSSDAETRAMYDRLVTYQRLVKTCGHRDGWLKLRIASDAYQCQSCGLVVTAKSWGELEALTHWPALEAEDAIATALVAWHSPLEGEGS